MNDSTLIKKAIENLNDADIAKFEPMELIMKSGRRLLAKVFASGSFLLLHMPVEYQIDAAGSISFRKLFPTSDSIIFSLDASAFDATASMNDRWVHTYNRMCGAYAPSANADSLSSDDSPSESISSPVTVH